MKLANILGLSLICLIGAACSTAPKSESGKQDLIADAGRTVNDFRASDSSIADRINDAYGMAVFPTVAKGGAGVGGAYGRGVVYEQDRPIGYCDLSQGSIGFQLGGQKYSELILFENKAALDRFKSGEFALAAQASAVAAASGSGANAKYNNGVMVFTLGEKGLMYEASVGGQKFAFKPL
jgi:lipid-binding SYLF domain-containing protein